MVKKRDYSRYKVEEVLDTISEGKGNWGKFLIKASMDDGPSTVDIRHLGIDEDGEYIIGKGISLRDDEADKLTDSLLEHGYGDMITLAREYKKRKNTFYPKETTEDEVISDIEKRA